MAASSRVKFLGKCVLVVASFLELRNLAIADIDQFAECDCLAEVLQKMLHLNDIILAGVLFSPVLAAAIVLATIEEIAASRRIRRHRSPGPARKAPTAQQPAMTIEPQLRHTA